MHKKMSGHLLTYSIQFHTVPEFTLPLNLARKFRASDNLSNALFYHLAKHPSLASKFFCN